MIKENYKSCFFFLKEKIFQILILSFVIFFSATLYGIYFSYQNIEEVEKILFTFLEAKPEIFSADGSIHSLYLIKNNVIACVTSIFYGIIPFLFLPLLSLLMNGFLLGITLGVGKLSMHIPILQTFLFGILPHGILEIPALLISMSIGIYLCKNITESLFGRKNRNKLDDLKNVIRVFFTIVIPLLILAGLLECYVTPYLLRLLEN